MVYQANRSAGHDSRPFSWHCGFFNSHSSVSSLSTPWSQMALGRKRMPKAGLLQPGAAFGNQLISLSILDAKYNPVQTIEPKKFDPNYRAF